MPAAAVEFQGTLHRNLRELHDAIAEQWLSASGSNTKTFIIKMLEHLTDGELSSNVIAFWALDANENVDRQMLTEAFARLRNDIDKHFSD